MTKPTQVQEMIWWFQRHGYRATLGDILSSGERWSYEWRARATEARKLGYTILLERGKEPSDNLYKMMPPDGTQMRMAI